MVKLSINDNDTILSFNNNKMHNFEFTSLIKEHQDQKDKIKKGSYGYGAKFILDYNKELTKLNDFSKYNSIASKFQTLCNQLALATNNNEQKSQIVTIKQEPIDDPNIINETLNEEQTKKKSKKIKKRTIDEATAATEIATNDLNQTKTITKKKKKLKAKRISKTTNSINKLDTTADLVAKNLLDQSVKSEKLSILVSNNTTNLSVVKPDAKKIRLSGKPLKKKKKSMKTKKKSSVMSKKTTTSTSSLADCLTSTKFEFNESNLLNKTPAKLNLTRLNSIMESNSKTIKAEPRRQPSIHASGKVKQMVELVEARMKTTSMQNTPSTVVKQQQQQSKQPQIKSKLSNTSTLNSVAKKLRSSIDERKKRISNSKIENKRQSSKRVNAFLNDLVQQKTSAAVTVAPAETKTNNVKKKLNYQEIKQEPIDHDTELTKPLPPPTQTINTTTTTTTTTATTSSNNGLAHLLATSTLIQQNYKLKYTSSLNSDTKKQSLAATTANNYKFLERNTTPCKSKELEEKRKIELIYKEEKEQKRLQEREKLLHEKIVTAKKKREEKMKKINEMKTQQQEDVLKRKEELEMKQREAEENKKRLLEEKRKEEFEKQKLKEQQRIQTTISISNSNNQLNHATNLLNSVQKIQKSSAVKLNLQQPTTPFHHHSKPFENKTNTQLKQNIIKTPSSSITNKQQHHYHHHLGSTNKHGGTPGVKKKLYENYDINDLESDDDTDDDEEPSKPIPEWAKEPHLKQKALRQCYKLINYTKLFRASSQNEIILENIFKIKRKKFAERSSSAIWNSPPVWSTNGLNGEESFRQLHKL